MKENYKYAYKNLKNYFLKIFFSIDNKIFVCYIQNIKEKNNGNKNLFTYD